MKITSYKITTGMGKLRGDSYLPLTESEIEEFNVIGYTGKNSAGVKTTYVEYLNSLNKGIFSIVQTKHDDGTYIEEFIINRCEKSVIQHDDIIDTYNEIVDMLKDMSNKIDKYNEMLKVKDNVIEVTVPKGRSITDISMHYKLGKAFISFK